MVEIPADMLKRANACEWIRGRVFPDAAREPIVHDGEVVGFVSPHQGRHGFRLGPIWIEPEHRGKGLAAKVVAAYADKHPDLCHWLADRNEATLRMHLSIGFRLWRRGSRGGWYRRVSS